ncbi:MAG: phospholipid carrier-dependent glycosyltransferase [Planctomycetes bacterium]|nr:phospholipid carrier-dependent glycosyltransferase [Planctomycetota bacterium]MCP4839246.1 phospholipid carrier-dependent glycosyltransferase [Planctomycetota bacterium]
MKQLSAQRAESRRFTRWAIIGLIVIFIGIYVLPLGLRPMVVPDEARYAAIPAEMIRTGEWTVPHLAGIRYFEKPVLGYWMTAASFLAFGENTEALRLPSAVMSGLAIIMILLFVRRWTGRWDIATLSGVVLATCLEPVILGTTAILDAPFAACVTATIVCFYLGWRSQSSSKYGWLISAGVACGAAFLIKGFLAVALPTMVLAPWLAWSGRWKDLVTLPWLPAAAAIATALPWSIAVHGASPEYWDYFFWVEHIQRFTGGAEAQHPEPWWFFAPILVVGLIPWLFASPLAVMGLARRGFGSPESRLLLCWAVLPLIFFSVSSGKLPTYILPCFPPFAALITVGLIEHFGSVDNHRRVGQLIPGSILAVIGIVAIVSSPFIPTDSVHGGPWEDGGTWRLAIVGLTLLFWGGTDWVSCRSDDGLRRVFIGGIGAAAFLAIMPSLLPTGWMKISKAPMAWLHQWTPLAERSTVLADRDLIHAGYWIWPNADVHLFGNPGEMKWGVMNFKEHAEAHIQTSDLAKAVQAASLEQPVILVVTRPDQYQKIIGRLVGINHISEPATKSDRDVLLAVWPAEAMPAN